ncbi:hypothetical protein PUN28_013282 [Cardiocondyla obscurior]|uniref:Uncharacterized protein n=1 Tax=Cardiocondyla obscurior TaxID=286306 RepID=A0AAW2FAS2_9HYME
MPSQTLQTRNRWQFSSRRGLSSLARPCYKVISRVILPGSLSLRYVLNVALGLQLQLHFAFPILFFGTLKRDRSLGDISSKAHFGVIIEDTATHCDVSI